MSFSVGDLVFLKSGSMRMVVEAVDADDGTVSTVWCNDGKIGRDNFAPVLLNKVEERAERPGHGGRDRDDRAGGGWKGRDRDDDRGGDRGSDRRGGYGGGHRDDRGGGWKGRDRDDDRGGYRGRDRDDRAGDRGGDRPRGKPGWDGKPRDKKYFRRDD